MSNPRLAEALLTAATHGQVENVRRLLAEDAPLESVNVNRWTPVMCAAAHGHDEAFQMLVEAGANLHALGFRQTDLLELAADGGNARIVRDLLHRGLPVDGHWQLPVPPNPVLLKVGHDTPLIRAAADGNVEIVRILLEAGADRSRKHQGKTALDLAKECLSDPDCEEQHESYREIVTLLGGQAVSARLADSINTEIDRFAENARRPEFQRLRELLAARCGAGRKWRPRPDHGRPAENVLSFTLRKADPQAIGELQRAARVAECCLVLNDLWLPGENAKLALFPTSDKFAVVAAVGTEGASRGIKTIPHVIDWLRELDSKHPFHLDLCTHEAIGGTFEGAVKGAKKLAERIIAFCPDVEADTDALASTLKKDKSFLLRWD